MGSARLVRDGLARSLTLLRVFVYASGALLLAGVVVLASTVTSVLREQAVVEERRDVAQFVETALGNQLVRGERLVLDARARSALDRGLRARDDLISAKVWAPDGTLLWASLEPSRIGRRFELSGGLAAVIATGLPAGHVEDLRQEGEESAEARITDRVLEVYAPVLSERGRPIGAYELYIDTEGLDRAVDDAVLTVWLAVIGVFAALYLLLIALVRGASRRMRRQTETLRARSAELMDSYRQLQESSLEAIESLNATVEAKDPYTAGHSRRVRELAVAVGRELGLAREQLDTLALSALFHDIGKLAVPDAILTKPDRLTREEFELIKEHSARGAEIVGKLSRLAPATPAIRHHHERWDGHGYPDGLAREEIPLEAAIVGLADAWDAMTTERPYAPALSVAAALEQVREGRGTQFDPRVVDAFLAVARRAHRGVVEPTPQLLAAG
jgi:putative nucleotidyltransferase with HDIG domain